MARLSIIAVTLANCSVILFYDDMIEACSSKAISLDITRPTHRLPIITRNPMSLIQAVSKIIDTRRLKNLTAEHQAIHQRDLRNCDQHEGDADSQPFKKAWENYCKNRRRHEKVFIKDVKAMFKKEQPVIDNK